MELNGVLEIKRHLRKYWVNNHAHVVRPIKEKLIDTFLVSYLNSIDLTHILRCNGPKIKSRKLRSIKITSHLSKPRTNRGGIGWVCSYYF
jgi:hypothetical protein